VDECSAKWRGWVVAKRISGIAAAPPILRPFWAHGTLFLMRIIARRTLREFVAKHAGHKDTMALSNALNAWFDEVRRAKWKTMMDVKKLYVTASVISAERVVFNINGNSYRLATSIDFEKSIVWIKWLGTHKDYDRIDMLKVQYDR